MKVEAAGATDTGLVRRNNEDAYALAPPGGSVWWGLVCDGLGGHAAGEVAARAAVDFLRDAFNVLGADEVTEERIADLAAKANEVVCAEARGDARRDGMGTTMAVLFLLPEKKRLVHANVGDSRIYRLRDGMLKRLTFDHTTAEDLKRAGIHLAASASQHGAFLSRVLGMDGDFPGAEVLTRDLAAGDVYLLCSDGLTGVVEEEMIAEVLSAEAPKAAVERLIERAREGGAPDNVTAIVARVG